MFRYCLCLRGLAREEQLVAAGDDSAEEYDDLLSRLPEPLIHHVLSFLPLKEIVKASAVCKSWGRIFSSFPVLDLRSREFVGKGSLGDAQTAQRMVRFVDATMKRFQEQHLKVDKLRIDYPHFGELTDDCLSRIDKWIGIALDNNAHEIHMARSWSVFRYHERTLPDPPPLDLVALSSSTNLKSLRSLTLDGFMNGEFLSWGRLISALGSLESLSITDCRLKEVQISGLPNLKTVSITGCTPTSRVEIEAPRLECFSLKDYSFDIRTHPRVINVNHSPNLKSLTLRYVAQNDVWFRDFLSRFQRLRYLTLRCCNSVTRIRISSPSIEDIKLIECCNLTDISIEAPDLRRFHLESTFNGLLPSIRMKDPPRRNPVAEVNVYFPKSEEPQHGLWSHELRKFLAGPCMSFSSLSLRAHSSDFELKLRNDIKYRWLGVVACNAGQFLLARGRATREPLPRAVDGADVNGLIWTPHPAAVTAVAGLSDDDFLQLFFDKVGERHSCLSYWCTSYPDDPNIGIDNL